MNSHKRDAASVRFPPPLVFALSILLGYLLGRYFWSWSFNVSLLIRAILGLVFVLPGIGLLTTGLLSFWRTGQSPEPWTSTPTILVDGIYSYTRNPMYLGMALVQTGIALFLANIWILILVPLSMLVVYRIAIKPEEEYLEEKFGESFIRYKQKVRRWL